jgi:VanZ family protein
MIRSLWLGVGWLGIVAAFVFSLGPASTLPTAMQHADKLVHLASYGILMFWWAQLYIASRERVRLAIALVLLGFLIEWLQGFTPTRQSDVLDALANTCGILLGWWLAQRSMNLLPLFSPRAVKSAGKQGPD